MIRSTFFITVVTVIFPSHLLKLFYNHLLIYHPRSLLHFLLKQLILGNTEQIVVYP